jgi:hypothetical protein
VKYILFCIEFNHWLQLLAQVTLAWVLRLDRLASKGITKLFPIQVMRSGGSSSLFRLKMNHILVDVHGWIKAT